MRPFISSMVGIVLFLSAMMVFINPLPVKPNTSIGLMGMFIVVITSYVMLDRARTLVIVLRAPTAQDVFLVTFYISGLISVIFSDIQPDITNTKIMTYGVVFYFTLKALALTKNDMRVIFSALSNSAVILSAISLFQFFFPDFMNEVAGNYFFGREVYGLAREFVRGRLFPWGATIFLSPFFFARTLPNVMRGVREGRLYFFVGFTLISLTIVVSNFRWIFINYIVVTIYTISVFVKRIRPDRVRFYTLVILLFSVFWTGLFLAESTFGYNLLDRFLLSHHHRDVEETLGRLNLYDQALEVFLSKPIFGAGTGNYFDLVSPLVHLKYFDIFDQQAAIFFPIASHNEFLTVLAENGFVGFLCFLLFIYVFVRRVVQLVLLSPGEDSDDIAWTIGISGMAMSVMLYILFENLFPQNYVLLFGIASLSLYHIGADTHGKT